MSDTLFESYAGSFTNSWSITKNSGDSTYSKAGQTFTPSRKHTLTSVKLDLAKYGTPTQALNIYVYATSGGLPTGSPISSGSVSPSSLQSWTSHGFVEISMSSVTLYAGTQYALCAQTEDLSDASNQNWYIWGMSSAQGYSNGTTIVVGYAGHQYWETQPYDMLFYEYGLPLTFTLTISISGQGTTSPSAGSHTYDKDSIVSVDASPSAGWSYYSWSDAGAKTHDITITADVTLTATFRKLLGGLFFCMG